MTIEEQVTQLTAATTALLESVNVKKASLDSSEAAAATSAASAAASATASSNSANLALSVYGTAAGLNAAQQIMLGYANTARSEAAAAAAFAQAAASVAQQDLSGVTNAGLHFTPNAVVDTLIYDTSRDSDGGAWVERCLSQSWATEPLSGPWLAATSAHGFQSELAARAAGATLGAEVNPAPAGDFAVGWTPTAGVSIVGGKLVVGTTLTTGNAATTTVPAVAGTLYFVSMTIESFPAGASGGCSPVYGAGNVTTGFNGAGTFTDVLVASSTGQLVLAVRGGNLPAGTVVSRLSVRPITALNTTSGSYYNLATDGKHYRLSQKNLLLNSAFAGGASGVYGSGAATPTSWSSPIATGQITFASSTRNSGGQQVRYQATAQRPYLSQTINATAGATYILSCYVEALTSGTPQFQDVLNCLPVPSGATTTYRHNGGAATASTAVAAGDLLEVIVAVGSTAGTIQCRHGLGANINSTGDVTLSPPQLEYSLNGSTATTCEVTTTTSYAETFRGNTAKFPRLAGIVAEATRTSIYDLTQPGRPMWMVFGSAGGVSAVRTGNIGSLAARDGELFVGGSASAGDLHRINFIKDGAESWADGGGVRTYLGNLAQRNGGRGHSFAVRPGGTLASRFVNAVAVMVRPNAPIDPTTLLPVPTIGVAVGTGNAGQIGTVLMDDGTAVNYSTPTNDGTGVAFTARGEVAWTASTSSAILVMPLATSNVTSLFSSPPANARVYGNTSTVWSGPGINKSVSVAGRNVAMFGRSTSALNTVVQVRENPSTPAAGLAAHITGTYNTGWMTGDIRRCLLADTQAGATSVLTLGSLGTPSSYDNTTTGTTASFTASSGTTAVRAYVNLPTLVVGRSYTVAFTMSGSNTTVYACNTSNGGGTVTQVSAGSSIGAGSYVYQFTATSATSSLLWVANAGGSYTVTGLTVEDGVQDRSVKARPPRITGTLALSAVAAAAQLVAASGFNASNYIQEAYSADLDFGAGAWTVSFWGTIPTNVSAAGWAVDRSAGTGPYFRVGHSATGQIVAEMSDGSTVRTLTAAGTFNNGLPIKVRASYVPNGANSVMTINVNGVQIAQSVTPFAAVATMNNASAVLTVGIDRALSAPWAGSLALVKVGATVPTADQAAWMFAQERAMFQPGAQVTLSDTGSVVRMRYGDITDRLMVQTASNEDEFQGLVRFSTQASAGGSYVSGDIGGGGAQILARNNGGARQVTVTIPPRNLQAEMYRRAEDAARLARLPFTMDADAAASQTDFTLPPGTEAVEVYAARQAQREGASRDYVRVFDGFRETVRFNTGQALNTWVQIQARRTA